MNVNINGFGSELFNYTRKSHEAKTEEQIKTELKQLFDYFGVNDSNFALIGLAVKENNSVEGEIKTASTYIDKLAHKLYTKELSKAKKEGKEITEERKIENSEKKFPKFEIKFENINLNNLKPHQIRDHILEHLDEILSVQGYDENDIKAIQNALYSNSGDFSGTRIDETTIDIISKAINEISYNAKMFGSYQSRHQDKNNNSDENKLQKNTTINISKEKSEKAKSNNPFYEGNDINFFNNFDKQQVSLLFHGEGKEEVLKFFKDFVSKFNELMTKLTRDTLDLKTLEDLSNDIEPYYNVLISKCAGDDGAKIKNLADGMTTVLNVTFKLKENGKNLNAKAIQYIRYDHTDDRGVVPRKTNSQQTTPENETSITSTKTTTESLLTEQDTSNIIDNVNKFTKAGANAITDIVKNIIGTENLATSNDELTQEDQEEIDMYGITDITTHSQMEEFRKSEEYELIQNMQRLGLSRSDTSED